MPFRAAANHVRLRRRRPDAASKPVLDDPVGIIHAKMTREKVKDVCFLTPEQKLDPAKNHSRPSSVHTFPTN